jgi:hypothetical protein
MSVLARGTRLKVRVVITRLSAAQQQRLAVGHHAPRGALIGLVQAMSRAQLALSLGGLLGQDMAPVRGIAFESASGGAGEALGCTTVRLNFGHFVISLTSEYAMSDQPRAFVVDVAQGFCPKSVSRKIAQKDRMAVF